MRGCRQYLESSHLLRLEIGSRESSTGHADWAHREGEGQLVHVHAHGIYKHVHGICN